ncbi:unnamed protein product [Prunus brigantina]
MTTAISIRIENPNGQTDHAVSIVTMHCGDKDEGGNSYSGHKRMINKRQQFKCCSSSSSSNALINPST